MYFSSRRSTYRNVLNNGIGSNSYIIVARRNPGNNPNVRRVLCPASCVGDHRLNGRYTLVASNQFSKNASNLDVNRVDPRTTTNNGVNGVGSNSVVIVSVPDHSVGIGLSSRRLTTHPRRPLGHGHRMDGTLHTCTRDMDSTSGNNMEVVSWSFPNFPNGGIYL